MGVRVWVLGVRPIDQRFQKMKAVYDACAAAGVGVPEEVLDFFDGDDPPLYGIEVDIKEALIRVDEEETIYLVDLSKLPKDVKMIRVFYA